MIGWTNYAFLASSFLFYWEEQVLRLGKLFPSLCLCIPLTANVIRNLSCCRRGHRIPSHVDIWCHRRMKQSIAHDAWPVWSFHLPWTFLEVVNVPVRWHICEHDDQGEMFVPLSLSDSASSQKKQASFIFTSTLELWLHSTLKSILYVAETTRAVMHTYTIPGNITTNKLQLEAARHSVTILKKRTKLREQQSWTAWSMNCDPLTKKKVAALSPRRTSFHLLKPANGDTHAQASVTTLYILLQTNTLTLGRNDNFLGELWVPVTPSDVFSFHNQHGNWGERFHGMVKPPTSFPREANPWGLSVLCPWNTERQMSNKKSLTLGDCQWLWRRLPQLNGQPLGVGSGCFNHFASESDSYVCHGLVFFRQLLLSVTLHDLHYFSFSAIIVTATPLPPHQSC